MSSLHIKKCKQLFEEVFTCESSTLETEAGESPVFKANMGYIVRLTQDKEKNEEKKNPYWLYLHLREGQHLEYT